MNKLRELVFMYRLIQFFTNCWNDKQHTRQFPSSGSGIHAVDEIGMFIILILYTSSILVRSDSYHQSVYTDRHLRRFTRERAALAFLEKLTSIVILFEIPSVLSCFLGVYSVIFHPVAAAST